MFLIGIGFLGVTYLLQFGDIVTTIQWTTTFGIVFTIMSFFAHIKVKKMKKQKEEAQRYG